jgi:hypothetical protein
MHDVYKTVIPLGDAHEVLSNPIQMGLHYLKV